MLEAHIIRNSSELPWFYNPVAIGRTIEDIKNIFDNSKCFLITKYKNDGHFYGIYFEEGEYDEDGYIEPYEKQYLIEGYIRESKIKD